MTAKWHCQWQSSDSTNDSQVTAPMTVKWHRQWQSSDSTNDSQVTAPMTVKWQHQWQPSDTANDSQVTQPYSRVWYTDNGRHDQRRDADTSEVLTGYSIGNTLQTSRILTLKQGRPLPVHLFCVARTVGQVCESPSNWLTTLVAAHCEEELRKSCG